MKLENKVRKRSVGLMSRRLMGSVALVAVLGLSAAACSQENQVVTVTVTSTQGGAAQSQVLAPELTSSSAAAASSPVASTALGASLRVTAKPAFGSVNVAPNNPVTVTVFAATFAAAALKGDDGRVIAGTVSSDKGTWTSSERLTYGTGYTFSGTVASADGKTHPISGKISTVKPATTLRASVQIPNGDTVGVGAPIVITFSGVVTNRAAAEKALTVTTSAGTALEGNWGWLQDEQIQADGPVQSQVHWRPTKSTADSSTPYWPANTKVHVAAALQGVDLGGGQWGREDFASDFTIGRSQIVKADASSFRLFVTVDGKVTKNYAVSYGKESVPGRATVTGIHIVTELHPTFAMCNPEFDYCNVTEKWAVRINNNGEFIHENLKALAAFGKANISHGCINMNMPDAENYYNSVLYGDPVEVSNTGGPAMTEKDSLYDWIYSPQDWKALSAL